MNNFTAITFQVRVSDFEEGRKWYEIFLNRKPDFVPHGDFAEWELIPNAWLQVAKGTPTNGNGPLRIGVSDIKSERERLISELNVEIEEVQTRDGVPAAWCTFEDLYGNRIGLFQEL
jgi:hypothetical protein